ncbi:hypothetical protein ACHAXR_013054 [Thalassiosira sp. AJA248-18]
MASITTTSPIHHAQTLKNPMEGAGTRSGRKRRPPIDPEETGSVATTPYIGVGIVGPHAKRPRTIDDVLGSLSLRPPDPPGNSFCLKRKSGHGGMEEDATGRSAKMGRSSVTGCASTSTSIDESKNCGDGNSLEPSGRKGSSPTNVTSELDDPPMQQQQQCTSCAQPKNDCQCQQNNQEAAPPKSAFSENNNNNEMAIDDGSDHESCDSSVSEGSIRNAMYQLAFGRMNHHHPPLLLSGSSSVAAGCGGRYDAVDAKIENLIRRSRMEAVIKSQKKESEEEESGMEMDMDDGEIMNGGEVDWCPGHG